MSNIDVKDIKETLSTLQNVAKRNKSQLTHVKQQFKASPLRVKVGSYTAIEETFNFEMNQKMIYHELEIEKAKDQIDLLHRLKKLNKKPYPSNLLTTENEKTNITQRLQRFGLKGIGVVDTVKNQLVNDIFKNIKLSDLSSTKLQQLISKQAGKISLKEDMMVLQELIILKRFFEEAEQGRLQINKNRSPFKVIGKEGYLEEIFSILEEVNKKSQLADTLTKVRNTISKGFSRNIPLDQLISEQMEKVYQTEEMITLEGLKSLKLPESIQQSLITEQEEKVSKNADVIALKELMTLKRMLEKAEQGVVPLDAQLPLQIIGKDGFMEDVIKIIQKKNKNVLTGILSRSIPEKLTPQLLLSENMNGLLALEKHLSTEASNKSQKAITKEDVLIADELAMLAQLIKKATLGQLPIPFKDYQVKFKLIDHAFMLDILAALETLNYKKAKFEVIKLIKNINPSDLTSKKILTLTKEMKSTLGIQELMALSALLKKAEEGTIEIEDISTLEFVGPRMGQPTCWKKIYNSIQEKMKAFEVDTVSPQIALQFFAGRRF